MEKRLTKNEKGITLVALIITIIILLILAVVSIRAITGDNILEKAEAGKEKYTNSKEVEEDRLRNYVDYLDGNTQDAAKAYVNNELNAIFIIMPNDEVIAYINGNRIGRTAIRDIGDQSDMIKHLSIEVGKFFDAEFSDDMGARMGISKDKNVVYNFEVFEDRYEIQSSFNLDSSIDISSYIE